MGSARASARRLARSAPILRTARRTTRSACTFRSATRSEMKWLYATLAVLATVLIAVGAALGWLVGTEAGLLWAAAQVADKVSIEGLRGRLAGEIAFEKLTYGDENLRIEARAASVRPHL